MIFLAHLPGVCSAGRMAHTDLPATLPGVPALIVRLIHPDERRWFDQLLCERHYLHNATLVGETLRQVAVAPDGRWLALLAWSSPALHLRPRDRWIGWSEPQRAARLCLIAQNSRFLILSERAHYPNLASHLLARCTRRLPDDWVASHGHTVLVAESFVDPERYEGTCYKAAGWIALGPTGGFARDYREFYRDREHPKQLWVRALHPQACAWLCRESLPAPLAAQIPEAPPRCAYKSAQLGSLWQCYHDRLTDPRARRGQRHLLATILTLAAAATVTGERGPKSFAQFAARLSQPQRRHLRCRPHPETGKLAVPSEPTFRRAFKWLDRAQFLQLLAGWRAGHDPEKLPAVPRP
jgi:hypothetical protein